MAGGVAKATCNGELLTADMKVPATVTSSSFHCCGRYFSSVFHGPASA